MPYKYGQRFRVTVQNPLGSEQLRQPAIRDLLRKWRAAMANFIVSEINNFAYYNPKR